MKKTYFFVATTVLISFLKVNFAMANQKDYNYYFKAPHGGFSISVKANSPSDALEMAADQCLNKITNNPGSKSKIKVTEEMSWDIIDTCANPKLI